MDGAVCSYSRMRTERMRLPVLHDTILETTAKQKMGLQWLKLAKFGDKRSAKQPPHQRKCAGDHRHRRRL